MYSRPHYISVAARPGGAAFAIGVPSLAVEGHSDVCVRNKPALINRASHRAYPFSSRSGRLVIIIFFLVYSIMHSNGHCEKVTKTTVAYLPEYHFVSVFACHVTTFKY